MRVQDLGVLVLLVVALGAGASVGFACGGRLDALSRLRLRGLPYAAAALAVQLALPALRRSVRPLAIAVSLVAVAAWLFANRHHRRGLLVAFGLIVAGFWMNAAVIVANRTMPVDPAAIRMAGIPHGVDVARGHFDKHRLADHHTRLAMLDDRLPIARLQTIVSVGDVLFLVGAAGLIAVAMCERRGAPAIGVGVGGRDAMVVTGERPRSHEVAGATGAGVSGARPSSAPAGA